MTDAMNPLRERPLPEQLRTIVNRALRPEGGHLPPEKAAALYDETIERARALIQTGDE